MSNPGTSKDLGINDVSIVDLVERKFFALVCLPTSDILQREYKIFFGEHLLKCTNFKEGNAVKVKYGDGVKQGTIVKMSKGDLYLEKNYDEFVKTHEERIKQQNMKIPIGSHGTNISKEIYDSIDWTTYERATRGLLLALFSKEELATKSLSGRTLPTRTNLPQDTRMGRLDPDIVADIVELIMKKFKITQKEVRLAISSKCYSEKVTHEGGLIDEMLNT